jgi:hypothetical protein
MDLESFRQLSVRIKKASDKKSLALIMEHLAKLPVSHEKVALDIAAANKLKQLTSTETPNETPRIQ